MPLTTETTEDCMGVVHIGTGTVTGEELVAASRAALSLVQNTQNFHYEFVDFSDATELQFAKEHVDQITAQDRLAAVVRPDAVVIMVAPQPEFFALAKEWQQRVEDLGWSTFVARDRDTAISWLHDHFPTPPREKLAADIESASQVETERQVRD